MNQKLEKPKFDGFFVLRKVAYVQISPKSPKSIKNPPKSSSKTNKKLKFTCVGVNYLAA
jgi:hypothetical protein